MRLFIIMALLGSMICQEVKGQATQPKDAGDEATARLDEQKPSVSIRITIPDDMAFLGKKIEFIDKDGKVIDVIETEDWGSDEKITYPRVMDIVADRAQKHACVIEGTGVEGREYRFIYYDSTGMKLWETYICCGIWTLVGQQVRLSEEGNVVALSDVGEGGSCIVGEDGYPAPAGCAGVRIFTAEGEEIFKSDEWQIDDLDVSPKGKYVVYGSNDYRATYLFSVDRKKLWKLPNLEGLYPDRLAEDNGAIYFNHPKVIGPPVYRFTPEKGLEKLDEK